MAIEKMYFMNIAGPIKEVDKYVLDYVVPYEIQLVRTSTFLDSLEGLEVFDDQNAYEKLLKRASGLCKEMQIDAVEYPGVVEHGIDLTALEEEFVRIGDEFDVLSSKSKELKAERDRLTHIKEQTLLIQSLDVEVDKLLNFKFMKFRFGKVPIESFDQIAKYSENLNFIHFEVSRDTESVYVLYFMPRMYQKEIEDLFESLYFTRIKLSKEIKGLPKQALSEMESELIRLQNQLDNVNSEIERFTQKHKDKVQEAYGIIQQLSTVFTARQYAMHTKESFYMSGWIPARRVDKFIKEMKKSEAFSFEVEDEVAIKKANPPTQLSNNKFFKPFETFINMYGTPSYKEMDPTFFVGISYLVMFGIMFGDVGQGLVIAAIGYLLYRKTKAGLAMIVIYAGACSIISGLVYGSFFGNEEWIPEHLSFIPHVSPMHMVNPILGFAIGLGVFLIVLAMIFNLINSARRGAKGRFLFDRNGIIGFIFYFSVLIVVLSKVIDLKISATPFMVLIILSLIIIFISHPLQKWVDGKKDIIPKDKGGFFIESFFELVETVLAVLSNTLSFIRVGAFALNHVGFFMAFKMLAEMVEASTGAAGSIGILILGNIIIIVLEGFIVGIQCLRLEFYELFSRFFLGEGTEFRPFIKIKKYM